MPDHKEDLATLEQGEPVIRSVLALLIFLRFGAGAISDTYLTADKFINQLKQDLKQDLKG